MSPPFRTPAPKRRLLRAGLLSLALMLGLGGLAGLSLAQDADGDVHLNEAMGTPAARVGDRGYYTFSKVGPGDSEAVRRIAFEWTTPETLMDPVGTQRTVNVLSTRWVGADGKVLEPSAGEAHLAPNADRLLDANDGTAVAERASTALNGIVRVNYYGLFDYQHPWTFRDDHLLFSTPDDLQPGPMCGLRHALQGIAHPLRDVHLVFDNCELFGRLIERAEFHAERSLRFDGRAATSFAGRVPEGALRLWVDADLPYPVRWELTPASGPREVLTLDGFAPGDRDLASSSSSQAHFAPAAIPTRPVNFTGPDSRGVQHPFPLWRAWNATQDDPSVAAFLEKHPGAYMEAAMYYEAHEAHDSVRETRQTTSHEWFMGLTDGQERLYVEVTERTETWQGPAGSLLPPDGTVSGSRTTVGIWAHTDLDCDPFTAFYCPFLPGYGTSTPLPPDGVPTALPSVRGLYDAFSQAHSGESPNGWAFCLPCANGEHRLMVAGTSYGKTSDLKDATVVGVYNGDVSYDLRTVWADDQFRPVAAEAFQDSLEAVDPTLAPLAAPPVRGSNDVHLSSLATASPGWSLPPPSTTLAVVAAAGLVGLVYWAWPAIKAGSWSLFTRFDSPQLLGHPTRSAIHDYVSQHPGATFTQVQRGLALPNGVAQHHLAHLLRGGLLNERHGGKHRVFFVPGVIDRRIMEASVAIAGDAARRILQVVASEPGLGGSEIARRLGLARQTAHHHVQRLMAAGLLESQRVGPKICVSLSEMGRRTLAAR